MIVQAKKNNIEAILGDVLTGLPFGDQTFDLVIASNFLHGFSPENRTKIYRESARLTKQFVLFHDYNPTPNRLVTIIERIEGGYYQNFIRSVPEEMFSVFEDVKILSRKHTSSWYLGKKF